MGCEWWRMPNGSVMHVNLGHTLGPKRFCKFCRRHYRGGRECEFPVAEGRTCDAAMCDACATTLGRQETEIGGGLKRMNDTIDVCPIHREHAAVAGGKFLVEQVKAKVEVAQQQLLFSEERF